MTFTLYLLATLAFLVVAGLLFSFFHPGHQGGADGSPNRDKTDIKDTY